MNNKIKNLNYDNLLFVDIETVKGCNNFDENHPYYDVWAWKQRDKNTNEIPEAKEVIEAYNNKAALSAEWGKIVCISVGYIHNEELNVTSYTGEEEYILNRFLTLVKETNRMMVGHNLISFDVPYIRKRWFINNMGEYLTDKQGNDVYMKPWLLDDCIFDTMAAWKGSGFTNTSLDELAMSFGIPSSKDNMKGNEVSEYYYGGKIKEISEYCQKDVAVVANIVRVWKGDSILEPIIKEGVQHKDTRTVLEKLYDYNEFTEELQEEVKKLIGKKKLTKKDKSNIFTILRGVYLRTDFISSDMDSKNVVENKEKEIQQFIDTL